MKNLFKKLLPFLLVALIAVPVGAVTIQGLFGSSMQGGAAKMQGGSFSPLGISNLIAWYDAGLGITLNGSDVSQWDDLSGNSNNAVQATASNQPLFVSSDFFFLAACSLLYNQLDIKVDSFFHRATTDISISGFNITFKKVAHIFFISRRSDQCS